MSAFDVVDLDFAEPPAPKRSPTPPALALVAEAPPLRPPPSTYVAPDSRRAHGTRAKYVVERCRCQPCRAANRDAENARSHAIARPDEVWMPYVPALPARAHLADLAAAGVGLKTVAKLSGVSHGSLGKIVYGDASRHLVPSKRIRPATLAKILAVRAEAATGAQKVPAGPTWILLDELLAAGWTKSFLGRALGSMAEVASLQISGDRVRASTARKVEALHAHLAGRTAPARRSRWSR